MWTKRKTNLCRAGTWQRKKHCTYDVSMFYAKKEEIAGSSGLEVQKECVSSYRLKEEKLGIPEKDLIRKEAIFEVQEMKKTQVGSAAAASC